MRGTLQLFVDGVNVSSEFLESWGTDSGTYSTGAYTIKGWYKLNSNQEKLKTASYTLRLQGNIKSYLSSSVDTGHTIIAAGITSIYINGMTEGCTSAVTFSGSTLTFYNYPIGSQYKDNTINFSASCTIWYYK